MSEIVKLRKDAAAMLGVTARQLGDWAKNEPWFPEDGRTDAGWNVAAIRAARDAAGRKGSETSMEAIRLKLAREVEKLKQDEFRTRQEELKTREGEGELIPRRALELFAATVLTSLADWCDQIPDLIAGECSKKDRRKVCDRLKKELNAKREEMRVELERRARELPKQS